jgi:hypothetical protein
LLKAATMKLRCACVLLPIVCVPVVASADDAWQVTPRVLAGVEYLHYEEHGQLGDDPAAVIDKNTGLQPTARIEVDATGLHSRLFARASFNWTGGSTTYDGGEEDVATGAITPLQGPTTGYMLDADLIVGARGHLGSRVMLGGFVGIGEHVWNRDLVAIEGGYDESYTWPQLELGPRLDIAASSRLTLYSEGTVLVPAFHGNLHTSHDDDGYDDGDIPLGVDFGFRARIGAAWAITPRISVDALVAVEDDTISSSGSSPLTMGGQPVTEGGMQLYRSEPFSHTYRETFNVGASYRF